MLKLKKKKERMSKFPFLKSERFCIKEVVFSVN